MARTGIRPPRVVFAALAALTALLILLPGPTTGAYLTAAGSARSSAGVGNWCSVPNPAVSKNVYRLSDFTAISAPENGDPRGPKAAVRMLVLAVVNDASFAPVTGPDSVPGAAADQLGVRLWSCTKDMSTVQSVRFTAWRGNYTGTPSTQFEWDVAPATNAFAAARLNARSDTALNQTTTRTTKAGPELRDLHRKYNKLGGPVSNVDPVTMRYSWLLSTGRAKDATSTADPVCQVKSCHIDGADGVRNLNTVFSGVETAPTANAVTGNSVTYLAEKYYADSGVWPSTIAPRATLITPANGAATNTLLQDTTGSKIQYVVLEWWGGTTQPPADLEVEVFVN